MSPKAWAIYRETVMSGYEHFFGPPQIRRDAEGRIHRADGPAIVSPVKIQYYKEGRRHGPCIDVFGSRCYYYEGVFIPDFFWTNPERLTVSTVLAYGNAEIVAVGIKLMLEHSPNKEKDLEFVARDDWGALYQVEGQDKYMVLKVVNATPEPDGTFKDYYLLVPPHETPKAAVAWTFRKEEDEYAPALQT